MFKTVCGPIWAVGQMPVENESGSSAKGLLVQQVAAAGFRA